MSRYLTIGTLFFAGVLGIFLIMPSPSPIEDVEDVKQLIDNKEKISSCKSSSSVDIEYESDSSSLIAKNKQKRKIDIIEKLTEEENLKPLYKEWKRKGDLSYNIYIKKSSESEEFSQKLAPPAMPSLTTVEVSGEKIGVVIPIGTKGYIVTKEGSDINYQPIHTDRDNIELIVPPGVKK